MVKAGRRDVVSSLTCSRSANRTVSREEEDEVLEPQRIFPLEEKLRGEEAEVVARGRDVEAQVRSMLQEGTGNEQLGRAVPERGQEVAAAEVGHHSTKPDNLRESTSGGKLEANAFG